MTSISRPGGASITIPFREGIEIDRAVNDVRQRVDRCSTRPALGDPRAEAAKQSLG